MDKNNYSFTSYYIGANGDISYTVTTLDEDRRDRRMTIEELLEKIKQQGAILEELKKQVEELPEDEKTIRTMPNENEIFTYINSSDLEYHTFDCRSMFDKFPDKENSSVGNYFKSEEDAKMVLRAMKIEHAIRIRRIELNDGWEPDWEDLVKAKYFISFEYINNNTTDIYVDNSYEFEYLPIFGYYETYEMAYQIINEFKDDLLWYFEEYYPNKDKMYVWGE